MHAVVEYVTKSIEQRSRHSREKYLNLMSSLKSGTTHRVSLSCGNQAHGFAACDMHEKKAMREGVTPNIAIISAYNDLLSAHQPYQHYPFLLKKAIVASGGMCQFAGGVPAMCDGITQGQPGMDLSLFSRDVIAMSTAIALSHNLFDGALMLGICDKIVPGLLIGALRFGHLPCLFVPAGPMPSGISNAQKALVRQKYAKGQASKDELLEVEAASYHSPGTCTFYGTANSNQLLMEMMGLQLPGSSFVQPNTPLRQAFTEAAAQTIVSLAQQKTCLADLFDVKNLVNGMVGLLASGGSTNHTIHLVAIAQSAGYYIDWSDFDALSKATPLLASIYPNGQGDINEFQEAGGMPVLINELLQGGLLFEDVDTVAGFGMSRYTQVPFMCEGKLRWREFNLASKNTAILTTITNPFKGNGGVQLLKGNIGRAIIKTSALKLAINRIEAPALVFNSQQEIQQAYKEGLLNRDFVAVLRYQGPKASGMPELHQLTPILGALQDEGYGVALITDGRMSGASGKIPAAIHITPEASDGGILGLIAQGDVILMDWENGHLQLLVDEEEIAKRRVIQPKLDAHHNGFGRELFAAFRMSVSGAEQGACSLFLTKD